MAIEIHLNGGVVKVASPPDTPLLWVLRDELGLTGTKYGCGVAYCGACTVHIDGTPTRSCSVTLESLGDAKVTTIEAVSGPAAKAVQTAWRELDVVQCGYCQSGQMMSAIGLLAEMPKPNDADIDAAMSGNACRCATYHRIRLAIRRAAQVLDDNS